MEYVVAYLDLLGFKKLVFDKFGDALQNLKDCTDTLEIMFNDGKIDLNNYHREDLKKLAETRFIDRVSSFMPFSDSFFFMGKDPDMFLQQISSFILKCFRLTSHDYEHISGVITDTEIERIKKWHPPLFRGGISYGKGNQIDGISIKENKSIETSNFAGEAVINAVMLEKIVKGPRIIIDQNLFDKCCDETKSIYIQKLKEAESKEYYELLWPASIYILSNIQNEYLHELTKFNHLFNPAIKLWIAYNHTSYSECYFNFLKLIVNSTIKVFESKNKCSECKDYIITEIKKYGLELKIKDLF